jgi:hypothetical protein
VPGLDLVQRETTPSAIVRIVLGTLALAIRVAPEAFLEPCEVLWAKGPALLRDLGDVGASIVNPGASGWLALREKDDVGLRALGVRTEGATRATEDGVKVTVLHQDFEDFAGLLREQNVVGDNYRCSAPWLERRENVLDEVQLFVAGLDDEIITIGRLTGTLAPEGGIHENHVVALRTRRLVD